MPGAMDHIQTVEMVKSEIHSLDNNAHKEVARKLADPNDAVIPREQRIYEMAQKMMDDQKQRLSRAEDSFGKNIQFLGHVFATLGLRQAFPPSGPSHSYDWALINVNKSRLSTNKVYFLYSIE